jgi:hypothetical protein
MVRLFLGTGKKKKIQQVLQFFQEQERNKKLKVLSFKIRTKRALFMTYEELRVLVDLQNASFKVPEKVIRGLDLHLLKDRFEILLDYKSKEVEDKMLKVKTLTQCQGYIAKGVRAEVVLHTNKISDYKIFHHTKVRLHGPAEYVMGLKDQLVSESLCDPDSLSFTY